MRPKESAPDFLLVELVCVGAPFKPTALMGVFIFVFTFRSISARSNKVRTLYIIFWHDYLCVCDLSYGGREGATVVFYQWDLNNPNYNVTFIQIKSLLLPFYEFGRWPIVSPR